MVPGCRSDRRPVAMCGLAVLLWDQQRVLEAEGWFRTAAACGHTKARYRLGVFLENTNRTTALQSVHSRHTCCYGRPELRWSGPPG